jgi:hypothetical protein
MRLGRPPAGYGHWTLQLLADEMVALEIVDTISHETVRQVLKKTRPCGQIPGVMGRIGDLLPAA